MTTAVLEQPAIDYDRLDSDMEQDERGTPYTMGEAKAFLADECRYPVYVVQLMRFLVRRVERLEARQ